MWTLRGLARSSPRALLAGVLESRRRRPGGPASSASSPAATLVASSLVLAASAAHLPNVEGFFGAGTLLLVFELSLAAAHLRRARPRPISGHGWRAIARLAFRGAAHRPARSLLPVALIASAAFIIVSVEAFRKHAGRRRADRRSGTGGYALVASSRSRSGQDPETPRARGAWDSASRPELAGARFVRSASAGDDASCLNLYAPREPRSLARLGVRPRRPLLVRLVAGAHGGRATEPVAAARADREDGVVPAIADANSLEYSLHLAVGGETTVRGGNGAPVRLRIVAALVDSVLQGALIVSEANFLRVFPGTEGYRFFLSTLPATRAASAVGPLAERLADAGLRVESAAAAPGVVPRGREHLSLTFQSLGGLGLVLGTVGLLAVLLRNVLERRSELALLRAVGYRGATLAAMVVAEHVVLMVLGLACGTFGAGGDRAGPGRRGGAVPVAMVGLLLAGVTAAGLLSSVAAGLVALRSPLLAALRFE